MTTKLIRGKTRTMPEPWLNTVEIVERSSGYWLVDPLGAVAGPFATVKAAQRCAEQHDFQRMLA